jgi:hypothetical protein
MGKRGSCYLSTSVKASTAFANCTAA